MASECDIIERYVAVWNEADPEKRRQLIRSAWTPDGSSCHRLVDAVGYEAIEERVRGSWDKWLRDGKYIFRAKQAAIHHDAVKLEFVMVEVPEGRVEADGLSFLLRATGGRIARDYQFNPAFDEENETVDRYLAVLNEVDPIVRRRHIVELWAPDGMLVREVAVRTGFGELQAEAADAYNAHAAHGRIFASAHATHAHHGLVKFKWQTAADGTPPAAAGTDLLLLGSDGRIRVDYRFDDPSR
jgi:hypothetical protein